MSVMNIRNWHRITIKTQKELLGINTKIINKLKVLYDFLRFY